LYRAIQGDTGAAAPATPTAERREEVGPIRYEGPPTPCPAKVEYATPVFAKNYQGAWRYVVQIPYGTVVAAGHPGGALQALPTAPV